MEKKVVLSGIGLLLPGSNCSGGKSILSSLRNHTQLYKVDEHYKDILENSNKVGLVDKNIIEEIIPQKKRRRFDLLTSYLITSTDFAIKDAKLSIENINPYRIGNITGTAFGTASVTEKFHNDIESFGLKSASPLLFPNTVLNQATGQVSIEYGAKGVSTTICGSGNSGILALTYAVESIKNGEADLVIVGGVDINFPTLFKTFGANNLLANDKNGEETSMPFDERKNGLILGEGSVTLIVESEEHCLNRNGEIISYIHSIRNSYNGNKKNKINTMMSTLEGALNDINLNWTDIDYIASTANATYYDDYELEVYAKLTNKFSSKKGNAPYINSLKSITAEMNAASSLLAVADAAMVIKGIGISTSNSQPQLNTKYSNLNISKNVPTKIENSLVVDFDMAGYNSCVVLGGKNDI